METRFRVEGSEGVAKGDFGIHYGYPHGRTDEFSFVTRQYDGLPSCWLDVGFQDKWMPDAFAGPMLSLMEAIATGSESATSGRDNLTRVESMATVRPIPSSQELHQPVRPAEVNL